MDEPARLTGAEKDELELLGQVQYRSWCRRCALSRSADQGCRQELVLDDNFFGNETAPHLEVKDRKSEWMEESGGKKLVLKRQHGRLEWSAFPNDVSWLVHCLPLK